MQGRLDRLFFDKASSENLQFDALDGLRGVAVAFVVLSHFSNLRFAIGFDFSGVGKYGVYLFFALSAFLLTYPLVAGGAGALRDRRRWTRYAIRRVLRVFPLYYGVLVANHLAWLAGSRAFPAMDRESLVEHLLLGRGDHIYWTIPVELSYYLALPFVALALVGLLRNRPVSSILATAAAIAACLALLPPGASPTNTLNLGYYLPIFLLGSLTAQLHWQVGRAARRPAWLPRVCDLAAVAALAAIALLTPSVWSAVVEPVDKTHFHRSFAVFGGLWCVVLFGVMNGRGVTARVLASKPLRLVGIVSFSVYLWHWPILASVALAAAPGLGPLSACLTLAAIGGASMASYALIERPFIRSAWIQRRIRAIGAETS